jgi:hypothetical protein
VHPRCRTWNVFSPFPKKKLQKSNVMKWVMREIPGILDKAENSLDPVLDHRN